MAKASHANVTKGARRRAAMLDAATEVFLEKGFTAATLDDVIARSGGSRATLYAEFGDKEGLFAAIVAALCARVAEPLEMAHDAEPTEALITLARAYMGVLLAPENVALYRLVIGESRRFPRLARRVFEAGPQALAGSLSRYLRRAFGLRRPDLAARLFLEMVKGDFHTRALFGIGPAVSRREIDAASREAVRIFVAGLSSGTRNT